MLLRPVGEHLPGTDGVQLLDPVKEEQPDVTALPGPGKLLGNLLCAVAGLLDQNPAGALNGILNELLGIINRLLGGLL